jgi:hypothetical protein
MCGQTRAYRAHQPVVVADPAPGGEVAMTVYVDDMRLKARVGRLEARWSHLMTGPGDDLDELHALAVSIGLKREWFQSPPEHYPHYDVTETKRQQAIRAGAVAITWYEAGELLTGRRPVPAPPQPSAEEAAGQLSLLAQPETT